MKHIFILIISLSYLIPNNILVRSSLVDENDKPITNANIYCADNATRTNEKGAFSLYCDSLDTLHIKHIKF